MSLVFVTYIRVVKYVGFANPLYVLTQGAKDMYQNALFLDFCVGNATAGCAAAGYHPTSDLLAWEDYPVGGVVRVFSRLV